MARADNTVLEVACSTCVDCDTDLDDEDWLYEAVDGMAWWRGVYRPVIVLVCATCALKRGISLS